MSRAPTSPSPQRPEDKLKALYGESAVLYFVSLDKEDLVESDEVTRAFEAGSVVIESADESQFRQQLAKYLDSQHPFWPIVKRVREPFQSDEAQLPCAQGLADRFDSVLDRGRPSHQRAEQRLRVAPSVPLVSDPSPSYVPRTEIAARGGSTDARE